MNRLSAANSHRERNREAVTALRRLEELSSSVRGGDALERKFLPLELVNTLLTRGVAKMGVKFGESRRRVLRAS